ncbi:HlyD family secretion protein [Ruegeria atlantica]|uniref:HlyD family secretion protein n=1 Tax=Ruegeria atlantica TaxID=81569 RepID=UPI002494ADD6|nr:biotin/lipoyl-binding protein [Ruegeria atlantica]
MLEFLLCSLVTILPDYLFRRYAQGKRWGQDITFQSMWYELRWGIVSCFVLTVSLITMIFYYHPSTTHVSSFYRTLTILPESGGRVSEIYVDNRQHVEQGQPLFKLDDSSQQAAVITARKALGEIAAEEAVLSAELEAAEGLMRQAEGSLQQAIDELETNKELADRNSGIVGEREIERLELSVASRQGALDTAVANRDAVAVTLLQLIEAKRESAQARLDEALIALEKTTIYAGESGLLQQFALKVGDYVNPVLRPAGLLVPDTLGPTEFQAGFDQVNDQIFEVGMPAEISCISKPFTVVPMVVADIQEVIPAGQFRPTDQLTDIQDRARPGTVTIILEPLYAGGADGIKPGSKCIANAYTSNHDRIAHGDLGGGQKLFLHMVDTVGVVHAVILRIQTLLLPVQRLVFSGH